MSAMRRGRDAPLAAWFAARGWKPAPFQRETWRRYLDGESGLLHTPTGSGKTLAAFGGPLLEALAGDAPMAPGEGPRVLWVTPLRALAADTTRALTQTAADMGLAWTVALRTGDASARDKRLARQGKAQALVITPESLALLLSYADASSRFRALRCIVVDEWHELLGNKRGVLLQLCLARLRRLSPGVRTWGLSATLGNLDEARAVLLPHAPGSALVAGARPRRMQISTLLPERSRALPWAGHLGLSQLERVFKRLFDVRATLLFTNTRAQAELWHRALESIWPEAPATLALHHGSLDPKLRAAVEQGLRDGTVRCVVATSSLDLGVDFPAVDQVLQIGSPKGVARLLQRAGRARHRPGESGNVVCVPAQALELIEYAAARQAIARGEIESRPPPVGSLDVLAQHAVTLALGGGFEADELYREVRGTHAYAALDAATWRAVLDFIVQGGRALAKYPDYQRVVRDDDGRYRVRDRRVAFRHRLSIGTITADGAVAVRYLRGGSLGSVEEGFLARLRRGDRFQFAGRTLELVRLEGMVAYVRRAKGGDGPVATWQGGRMPLSTQLASEVESLYSHPGPHPEMRAVEPLLRIQAQASALPDRGRLVAERIGSRRGMHLFLFPFAGRAVHEGIAAMIALRWGRRQANTISYTVNDYGLMLTLAEPAALDDALLRQLLSPDNMADDLRDGVNLGEMARRQFREIARVAGLLTPSLPGQAARSLRQVQASSGLLYDVLRRYDPDHLLLAQAEREVFELQLEAPRLLAALHDCQRRELLLREPRALTPLSFPLWTESMRGQLSTETWQARVRRAAAQLEKRYERIA
ncbi:ligase-associated DNA damage response DEXH box helicase [Achromobacter xylosoxidans]|uniref:ligase-associated DNA damage response DEXH box helicase n=1 Tax=Alcaligenes xylosoxydans xylosoxydans TaxID=85698 RepID=UPI0006C6D550|nr:ligase-associated DNA damage response DEXH box helicase [Achromobacter xylosoxidans]CUI40190.1 Cold-shock DEAD box protein A [Achromobacter xylosoxidans]CUI78282.1 Cold-shock DEAD box protein A [Achromobacter xylosoxidans]CUJ16592.1 Cold-shock DEAD box protein A [Achromobacter xylosoxidans]CUJ95057.1 Cold-shock DEAD box protein A [Achromobacter xylosoxidans]CUR73528.1 Cold-shock DEAD box protein A [Achromobacter xylosoxidans]